MKLLGITDLHDHPASLERILDGAGPVDLILLGGDLTNFGSPADAERLVKLAQGSGATVLAVAGNCDSAAIDRRLEGMRLRLYASRRAADSEHRYGYSYASPGLMELLPAISRELDGMTQSELSARLAFLTQARSS